MSLMPSNKTKFSFSLTLSALLSSSQASWSFLSFSLEKGADPVFSNPLSMAYKHLLFWTYKIEISIYNQTNTSQIMFIILYFLSRFPRTSGLRNLFLWMNHEFLLTKIHKQKSFLSMRCWITTFFRTWIKHDLHVKDFIIKCLYFISNSKFI